MIHYARIPTPAGTLYAAAADGAITGIYFEKQQYFPRIAGWKEDASVAPLPECVKQIREYFDGKRKTFDLPLAPEGTDFQQRVWKQIARIPFGKTISYAELAKRAGAEGSARAAGAATGRNPITLVVPCHRVVGSDGSLTGYAGGLPRKTKLLEIEGALQGSLV
jgi:methylated-DNA-[protein]-cysteine S-methyltransferase